MKKTFRTFNGNEVANTFEFWRELWYDPSRVMKAVLESERSGLFIEYCEKNDFALRVRITSFSLDEVNELHKVLQAFAKRLCKLDTNGLYQFKVDAVIQASSFVKFTLNY